MKLSELPDLLQPLLQDKSPFDEWLRGKRKYEKVGSSGTACFDPICYFLVETLGAEVEPVVTHEYVFCRGVIIELCPELRELIEISDSLSEEHITKEMLVNAIDAWKHRDELRPSEEEDLE